MKLKYRWIKKVTSEKGQTMYFLGNGLRFLRCSEKKAVEGIGNGEYSMWEIGVTA